MSWGYDEGASAPKSSTQGGWGDLERPGPPPTSTGWGDGPASPPPSSAQSEPAGAPLVWLIVGIVVAIGALALGLLTESATMACLGWVMAGPVAIGVFGWALKVDIERRSQPWYRDSALGDWMRRLLVLASVAGVLANAWVIADNIARGIWT